MPGPRRVLLSSCLLLAAGGTAAAQNQPADPAPVGLSIGLRAGYGIPGGNVGSLSDGGEQLSLSDGVKGMVPFWLDLAYKITPHLGVGASLQYGFGLVNKEKSMCTDCTVEDIAFSANLYLHAVPGGKFDPWAGIGLGYEILGITNRSPEGEAKVKLEGFQYLVLQAGGDLATGTAISVGPFFSVSVGRYDTVNTTARLGGRSISQSEDIPKPSWHQWVTLGVQGRFNL